MTPRALFLRPQATARHFVVAILLAGFVPRGAFAFERHHYEEFPDLEGKTVEQVLLLGNNKTQDIILLREIKTAAGQPFHAAELWRDWERLVDLGLFSEIEVEAVPSGEGVLAVFSVHERPSWFVAPILDYDIDTKDITAGGQVRFLNLRGMNRQFRTRILTGARDSFSLSWTNPWVGSKKQSLGIEARVELPREVKTDLRSSLLGFSTTRFVGDYKRVRKGYTASARLEYLLRDEILGEDRVKQLSPTVGFGWFRDVRNVRIDPDRGTFFLAAGEISSGWITDDLNYLRGQVDTRAFQQIGSHFVAAARAQTILTTGSVPFYRRFALGGGSSIRGQPSDVITGNNLARASGELRVHILKTRRVALQIPFLPPKIGRLSNFDFRVDGVIFADAGATWDSLEQFEDSPVKVGGGFGFRLFLPFVELLRIEVAFDEKGNPTFYFREGNLI